MKLIIQILSVLCLVSCSTGFLKYNKSKEIFKNEEFEKKVLIKEVEPIVDVKQGQSTSTDLTQSLNYKPLEIPFQAPLDPKKSSSKSKKMKSKNKSQMQETDTIKRHLPEIEDPESFGSDRRPLVDPFRVGEKVVHTVSYFGTPAGVINFSVGSFLEVNGRKSYNFITSIKSSRLFSNFYSVQDQVETYVDYIDLVPHVFKLQVKETAQLKEAQSFFDHTNLKANYWENKYTEKHGHEEKKLSWEIAPYSQNAFSAIYYMRLFKWKVGKEYAFRVSDDEKNIVFKGTALESVILETDAGKFKAIKIKAEIVARGALTQTGDLLLWLSDDDRHYLLRIEAKIKIGTLVSEITELDPG